MVHLFRFLQNLDRYDSARGGRTLNPVSADVHIDFYITK